jgi:hypothetical protein
MKQLYPECDEVKRAKAKEYGYSDRYAEIIGCSQVLKRKVNEPVALDTNKTRREMVRPTRKGSY